MCSDLVDRLVGPSAEGFEDGPVDVNVEEPGGDSAGDDPIGEMPSCNHYYPKSYMVPIIPSPVHRARRCDGRGENAK